MHIMSHDNHMIKEPHGGKKLANVLKGVYWVNSLSNRKWPANSLRDANDMRNHSSLCVGMIHVLGEKNKRKLMCVLCFEWGVVSLFMKMNLLDWIIFSKKDF